MTPDYYVDLFRQSATFLKAPQGARPTIIASGGNDDDTSWTEALSSQVPRARSARSAFTTTPSRGIHGSNKGLRPASARISGSRPWRTRSGWRISSRRNSAVLDKYDPAKKVGFAVDEWGTWYDPEPGLEPGFLYQQNTLRDALVAAINLNIFHRHADRVRLASDRADGQCAAGDDPDQGAADAAHARPITRSACSGPFQDATLLPTYLQTPQYSLGAVSVPAVSISAARTSGGAIVVALVNLDPNQAIPVSATISGATRSA